ncbi:hypothetical protein [Methylomicrobium lacus]|uniref:hypothetical protein n=1 Tax=Methylomicrobium lacus TaxID=136992 RepID=UPI00045E5F69|nr:hypothetical protein [Methylomicrobium lacus]
MMRVILSILIFLGSCGGGYFVWRQAEKFSSQQSALVDLAKANLERGKSEIERIKTENSETKYRINMLRNSGFFDLNRVRTLDLFSALGKEFSFSLQDDEWSKLDNGKKLTAKISATFPHEMDLLTFLHRITQGKLGLLTWDHLEISRATTGLSLVATVTWFGVTKSMPGMARTH